MFIFLDDSSIYLIIQNQKYFGGVEKKKVILKFENNENLFWNLPFSKIYKIGFQKVDILR